MAANGQKNRVNGEQQPNSKSLRKKKKTFVGKEHQFLMIQPTGGPEDRLFDRFRVVVVFKFPAQPIFNS